MGLAETLAHAPADDFFWWVFCPAAAALAAFFGGFLFLRRERLIEDTPTSRIRAAAQGYVELEGRARLMDGPPIVSPLSLMPCVWWTYQIEQKCTDSRGRSSWQTIDRRTSDDCFLLDDGTGQCVVDPTGADVIPTLRNQWYGSTSFPKAGPMNAPRDLLAFMFRGDYRYTEQLILQQNPVYALGGFRTQNDALEAFDQGADLRELLDKWKHDKRMMALLDANRDGQVDQKEWEAARRMALQKVREAQGARALQTPDLNILARPPDGRPYILSGVPQSQLIRRFRAYSAACIVLFFSAGSFTLYALLARGLL